MGDADQPSTLRPDASASTSSGAACGPRPISQVGNQTESPATRIARPERTTLGSGACDQWEMEALPSNRLRFLRKHFPRRRYGDKRRGPSPSARACRVASRSSSPHRAPGGCIGRREDGVGVGQGTLTVEQLFASLWPVPLPVAAKQAAPLRLLPVRILLARRQGMLMCVGAAAGTRGANL